MSQWILITNLYGKYDNPHFTTEETKAPGFM